VEERIADIHEAFDIVVLLLSCCKSPNTSDLTINIKRLSILKIEMGGGTHYASN